MKNTDEHYRAVLRRRVKVSPDGCWLWTGMIDKTGGYPRWYAGDVNESWAHRNAYRLFVGPIPEGYHVDHLCFVRRCVNPAHLEAVTPAENARRAGAHKPLVHGTEAGFYRGCRCHKCVTAATRRARERVAESRRQFAAGRVEAPHGTLYTYSGLGCRCDKCRAAKREEKRRRDRAKGVRPFREAQHGTVSRYSSAVHKCRCDACRAAWSAYWKTHRAKKRAAKELEVAA